MSSRGNGMRIYIYMHIWWLPILDITSHISPVLSPLLLLAHSGSESSFQASATAVPRLDPSAPFLSFELQECVLRLLQIVPDKPQPAHMYIF